MLFSSEITALSKFTTNFTPPPLAKLLLILLSTTLRKISLPSLTYLFLFTSTAYIAFDAPLTTLLQATALIYLLRSLSELTSAILAFQTLHPGSLPSTPTNFLHMSWLAQFHTPRTSHGYLAPDALSPRPGSTPYTSTDPHHHQLTHPSPPDVATYLSDRLALYASTTSPAPLRLEPAYNAPQPRGSLHVVLHPADFERVVASGWGEAHSLAGKNACVPRTAALVFAPREYGEVCVVMRVVEAGARFLGEVGGGV